MNTTVYFHSAKYGFTKYLIPLGYPHCPFVRHQAGEVRESKDHFTDLAMENGGI